MKYSAIITTTDKKKVADKIIKNLLSKRFAACIQTVPVKSHYIWKKKIEKAKEFLILIKTKKNNYSKIEKEIKRIHNYSIPEIIEIPITKGSKGYLNWMNSEVK